jgi:hypothetical protein
MKNMATQREHKERWYNKFTFELDPEKGFFLYQNGCGEDIPRE